MDIKLLNINLERTSMLEKFVIQIERQSNLENTINASAR